MARLRAPLIPELPSLAETTGALVDGFQRNRLLTYASAIAFQVLTGLIPLLLLLLGLLGFFHLTEVWSKDIAPDLRPHVSKAAFEVIDRTVRQVLDEKRAFWVTAGAVLAVWSVSGAVRAAMEALDGVYRADRRRGFLERLRVSAALAVAMTVLYLTALAAVRFSPLAYGDVDGLPATLLFVLRWGVAAALVVLANALLLRFGPASPQPWRWVSVGTGLATGAVMLMSGGFGWYLTTLAEYGSLFGSLATVFVLCTYLYLGACFLLGGWQLDAYLRERSPDDDGLGRGSPAR